MKATGIVRRVDDLGRVVIPKEIRRNLRIREGEPLEIFVDREGEIILKKYSPIGELGNLAREYAAAINETINKAVLILDRDSVIAAAGISEKDFLGKGIGRFVERSMEERRALLFNYDKDKTEDSGIIDDDNIESKHFFHSELVIPIITQGDPIGAIVICSKEEDIGEIERKVAQSAALVISRQME